MPCPAHSPWFDLPNNIWWWVQKELSIGNWTGACSHATISGANDDFSKNKTSINLPLWW
jgi:hypothetical protein